MPEEMNSREAVEAMSGVTPQPQPAAINWESVKVDDIPVEVLKQHPAYKELLSESIERRQALSALRAQQEQPAKQPPAEQKTNDPLEAKLSEMQSLIDNLNQRIEADAQSRVSRARAMAIETYGIPEELHELVVGETEEEVIARAKKLSTFVVPQPHQGKSRTGNPDSSNAAEDELLSKVRARLTGADSTNIFSPGFQRQIGGGPVK